jgi:hypothetical protein
LKVTKTRKKTTKLKVFAVLYGKNVNSLITIADSEGNVKRVLVVDQGRNHPSLVTYS